MCKVSYKHKVKRKCKGCMSKEVTLKKNHTKCRFLAMNKGRQWSKVRDKQEEEMEQ